jgi:hypothetical protein
MPTAVERGIGVKAIIAVLKNEERGTPIEDTIRELAGDPPSELVGKGFGQDIGLLNFALPTDIRHYPSGAHVPPNPHRDNAQMHN